MNFQQRKQKALKEYLARFNTLALEIKYLNKAVIVHQITFGLQIGHFFFAIIS